MIIKFIAFVKSTGEINSLQRAKGSNNLLEGYDELYGATIVHVTSDLPNPAEFVETTVYNFDTQEWIPRPRRPNRLAEWNGTEWTWDKEDLYGLVKIARNNLLSDCDWTVLPDTALTEEQQAEARTYRQALRDIRDTIDLDVLQAAEDVVWPTKPDFL